MACTASVAMPSGTRSRGVVLARCMVLGTLTMTAALLAGCSSSGPAASGAASSVLLHGKVEYDGVVGAPCREGQTGWNLNVADGSGKVLKVVTTTAPVAHTGGSYPFCLASYSAQVPAASVYTIKVQDELGFSDMTFNAADVAGGKAVHQINGLAPDS